MNNIQLTPEGSIVIDGVKVGEWVNILGITKKYRLTKRGKWQYGTPETIIETIQQLLTNGFKPKKWEE